MLKWLLRNEEILFILAGVVLFRVPTLFEPYWYGDEGIYLTIGQALRNGRDLYSQIHDNKPPLLYLVAAIADGSQFWFRFITMFWNLATVGMFWVLARKWFDLKPAMWVTIAFALVVNIPLLEGNIANAELFFLLPTITSFYWLFSNKSPFWGGIILGFGALFKIPALLEVGIWPVFWLLSETKGWFKKSLAAGAGAVIPVVVSGIYFHFKGVGQSYLIATGAQNIPYLSSWESPVSFLTRIVVTCIVLVILVFIRKHISTKALLIGIAGIITLFAANLSGRPYPHYLLQMAGVISLGLGLVIWGKKKDVWVVAGLVALTVTTFVAIGYYAYPVRKYYANFLNFATRRIDKLDYFASFSSDVITNYEIAQTVANGSMMEDELFIWGDQPMIYALARRLPVGRYTVRYHIFDFGAQEETLSKLEAEPPRYIVSFGDEDKLEGLTSLINRSYTLEDSIGEAMVYRRNRVQ